MSFRFQLIGDLSGSVKRLLSLGCSEFWCTGRILVQVGRQFVFVVDGERVWSSFAFSLCFIAAECIIDFYHWMKSF
jgi:hypothetical protein